MERPSQPVQSGFPKGTCISPLARPKAGVHNPFSTASRPAGA